MNVRWYVTAAALLLVPCFWQNRLQAGDLSSHIYNAWLAQLIAAGRAPGLTVSFHTTNLLFDWILSALLPVFGSNAAQRIAVAVAVQIFVWGAFAFVRTGSGRARWALLPLLAMLAYGWVFHVGFFNFYLSLGICFWALSLAWTRTPRGMAVAVALLGVAWLAHNLPVVWSAGIFGYAWITASWSARRRALLIGVSVVCMALVQVAVRTTMSWYWSTSQFLLTTGADQTHVFDDKYYFISAGVFLFFGLLFVDLVSQSGWRKVVNGVPFQICLLTAAAVAILPSSIMGPGIHAAYLSDRMSLPLAICICVLLGPVPVGKARAGGLAALAVLYFGMLYRDERWLNRFEDRLEATVAQAPLNSRVISLIADPDLHINAMTHMIDRVCIGRCYSYSNYEPSTGEFRIHVHGPNPIVAATYADSWRMQTGNYEVREGDLPLYAIVMDEAENMVVRELKAGDRPQARYWKALPNVF
jgi:hypothetical protein